MTAPVQSAEAGSASHRIWRRHRVAVVLGSIAVVLVVAIGIGEWLGWPFLAGPMQRSLSSLLERPVTLAAATGEAARTDRASGTRVRFLGGLSLTTDRLEIGGPAWSRSGHMLIVENGTVQMRYIDLWRARGGGALRIKQLRAQRADAVIERLADGRASWQFAKEPKPEADDKSPIPRFDRLQVDEGVFVYRDAIVKADVKGRLSLKEGAVAGGGVGAGLRAQASGTYKSQALEAELRSAGVLPWISDDSAAEPLPLFIDLRSGPSRFRFDGTATDVLNLAGLSGRVRLSGPSLSAVGDAVGVTLPTTHPFVANGLVQKQGSIWNVRVEQANIGDSRLNASLRYESERKVPLLAGRVGGTKLLLSDLGPVIGNEPKAPAAPAAASSPPRPGRVLPDRAFDLPSLRAMDANVLLEFAELDLGTEKLEAMRPLRAHLKLQGGVLDISDIEARTAEGRLYGSVGLDGTGRQAIWRTDLKWQGIRLDRWLSQARPNGAPPYITGEVRGLAKLEGRGRSTAEILADLNGQLRTELRNGTISHLLVEAAGLDVAEALARLLRGDESLKVGCGLADFQATKGVLRPRAFVVDTNDSVLWIDGSVSMIDEALDLRAVVTPKDFSPLTLRTPLRVRGSLASPKVSVESTPLLPKIGASILLGLINPLAALLPLIDTGGKNQDENPGCRNLVQRASSAAPRAGEVPAGR